MNNNDMGKLFGPLNERFVKSTSDLQLCFISYFTNYVVLEPI